MLCTQCYEFIVINGDDDFINKREPKQRPHPSPCLPEPGSRRSSCACPVLEQQQQHFQGPRF